MFATWGVGAEVEFHLTKSVCANKVELAIIDSNKKTTSFKL